MKISGYTLKKIESLFEELGFSVRYGQGNFQSGYCWVNQNKVVVINKFFDTEARISILVEILRNSLFSSEKLEEKQLKFLDEVLSFNIRSTFDNENS
jgi:hypothetical protein